MTVIFPNNTGLIIDEIRNTIGREINFYVSASGIPCSLCELDPVAGISVDSLCSGCGGNYWINAVSGWPTVAHISWVDAGRPLMSPGGYVLDGDCAVTISSSGNALTNVENAEYAIVDGRDLVVSDFTLKGFKELNRITVALVEREG